MLEGEFKKTLAIDFDGTIVEMDFPEIGALKPFAKETLEVLKQEGHNIIIWTCRYGDKEKQVKKFLADNEIPYDTINDHIPQNVKDLRHLHPDTRKVFADIYIDDRQIFWLDDWKMIAERLGIWKKVLKLWKRRFQTEKSV
jgi:hydroxymethylpyrimidine pyrophosphatase-like HAD family hydrolase